MIRFSGIGDSGEAVTPPCKAHHYRLLPMKGLGKSMEGVGLNEPVIIPQSAALDGVIWGYTEAEIERRAYELKAEVKWMELPPHNVEDERKFLIWFCEEK